MPTLLQALAQLAEPGGDLRGQRLRAQVRLQRVRAAEDMATSVQGRRLAQVVETVGEGTPDRVRPVGVDEDPLHVADDEVGRVRRIGSVDLELAQGGAQVLVLALVRGREAAALPHVGPTIAAAGLPDTALEARGRAGGILLGGRRLPQEMSEVAKALLRALALAQLAAARLLDEGGGGQRLGAGSALPCRAGRRQRTDPAGTETAPDKSAPATSTAGGTPSVP
ncbi:hypothetical protein [Methylobacterium sp. PvR107]|uniref:hypothetical protein n=1 Tax=Methylobacterium sp. PvR107 TaxID=2806597 RepID=UPI001AE3E530|nr:hypothetical protein [Methylobacterium sp. PvR107]MBP1184062.1 hypothetical protein [Methylobacterium sp. PvR107]